MQKASKLFFKPQNFQAQSSFIDTICLYYLWFSQGYAGRPSLPDIIVAAVSPTPLSMGLDTSYIIYSAKALCIMFSNLN